MALTWSANCVITSLEKILVTSGQGDNPEIRDNSPTGATFKIKEANFYVPGVTLPAENGNKLLEQLKAGFKRTIKWNKYRSEMYNQAQNNNLNSLIDPKFTNVNRLIVLSFANEEDRTSFSKYYNTNVAFKNCAPFTRCVTHINDEHVEAAENLDIIMPMYNLLEYSDN